MSGENREVVTQGLDSLIPVTNQKYEAKGDFAGSKRQKQYEQALFVQNQRDLKNFINESTQRRTQTNMKGNNF